MIISGLKIKNYKSLDDVQMNNIENIVVLTGKNSSGKSNLLEALWLFSKDFSLFPLEQNTNIPVEQNSHLWTNANTDVPIEMTVIYRFTPNEIRQVLPSELINKLNFSRKNIDVTINREISGEKPNITWITKSLSISDLLIINNGVQVTKLSPYSYEKNSNDKDIQVPLSFIESENQIDDIISYFDTLTPEIINGILEKITQLCLNNTKMIFSSRSAPSANPNYGTRTLNIEPSIYNKIVSEGQNLKNIIRNQWRKFVTDFENLIPFNQRISVISGQAIVDEANISLPVHQIGGGTQGLLSLLHELYFEVKPIFFIEEPENHLHPELQKKLFKYFNEIVSPRSREKQIWVSTHSPFLLNKSDIQNIWVAKKENNVTQISNLVEKEDLKNILIELGVKPSDVLFSDALLLVDGVTEEIVLPIWANKLGIDLVELGCDLIGIGGDEKGKYHIDMWRTITRDAQIPVFMILDNHAKKEAEELINEGKIDEECCIISEKQSIEEYYKKEYVLQAIKDEFGIEIDKSELKDTKSSTIKDVLIKKGMEMDRNWWKPLIGRRVANMMNKEEIPYEYRRIVEKIKITLQ
jgi:predicted ATP-dependent endonuclease of OLD family